MQKYVHNFRFLGGSEEEHHQGPQYDSDVVVPGAEATGRFEGPKGNSNTISALPRADISTCGGLKSKKQQKKKIFKIVKEKDAEYVPDTDDEDEDADPVN